VLKEYINELAENKLAGRFLSFSSFQIFYALYLISKKTIARAKIAEQLNVGEGTVRTILSRLIKDDLVKTSNVGCMLTVEGSHVCRELEKVFPRHSEFPRTELTPSAFNYTFVIRNGSDKVSSGIEQRDKAITVGAKSALVINFIRGRLRINSVSDEIGKTFPTVARQILEDFKPEENDAIVIASGETALKAMHGAFAASWSLLGDQGH